MKTKTQWDKKTLEVLGAIRPSLEKLLGETDFPPDRETVEKFIDALSMYGFHAFDADNYLGIKRSGIEPKYSYGNMYFIVDRFITEKDINHAKPGEASSISIEEYFERLGNSLYTGVRYYNKIDSIGVLFAVINRNKAADDDVKKSIEEQGELFERRGAGFLWGSYGFGNVLDEGAFSEFIGYKIRKEAIVGFFVGYADTPEFQRRTKMELIKDFYEKVVEDFMSK